MEEIKGEEDGREGDRKCGEGERKKEEWVGGRAEKRKRERK